MVVVFFFAGEASAEAVVDFLVVELFLVVDVPCVVVEALVVACGCSFFWDWQPTNATTASTVIKVKTDIFIGVG